ncbi:MAG TPA: sulfopyruvate decarboxylase subunit alpha, partial [Candidatus Methanoperedenaceae archaeon]|nr:sulfopyruvate decarboxylase subunit alpha [Candidatus Methanoperedenaceae archaeon]
MRPDEPEQTIINILKECGIRLAATLPCDRIKALLPLIKENIPTFELTREENGVGICAGAYLGGVKPVMVIQSTGLGNMLNALCSLNITYRIPLPIIASWRGVYKEDIPAQKPFGEMLPGILRSAGIALTTVNSPEELSRVAGSVDDALRNLRPHVVLVSPAVWELSSCRIPEPDISGRMSTRLDFRSEIREPLLTRYEAIRAIVAELSDDAVICNLGVPGKELFELGDRELNFYMLGSMGLASSIGLGLASVRRDRHVIVLDGDGSLLMNPNALISIGAYNPENLSIIAIDNAAYGSTGNQETCTHNQIDLELLARAGGIADTIKVHSEAELK